MSGDASAAELWRRWLDAHGDSHRKYAGHDPAQPLSKRQAVSWRHWVPEEGGLDARELNPDAKLMPLLQRDHRALARPIASLDPRQLSHFQLQPLPPGDARADPGGRTAAAPSARGPGAWMAALEEATAAPAKANPAEKRSLSERILECYRDVQRLRPPGVREEDWLQTVYPKEYSKMSAEAIQELSSKQSLAILKRWQGEHGQAQPALADAIGRLVKSLIRYEQKMEKNTEHSLNQQQLNVKLPCQ